MKHDVEFKGFGSNQTLEPKEKIRDLIKNLLTRLEKRAKAFWTCPRF
jgi:hypothetical protein